MSWQVIAIVAPLFFVTYQAFSKLLPSDISPFLVSAYASAVGALFMFALYFLTSAQKTYALTTKSLWLVIGIGILISLGNAAIIKAYGLGAPQSGFTSIFYPLLIIYAVSLGLIFWQEKLNWYQFLGALLSITGIILMIYFKRQGSQDSFNIIPEGHTTV